MNVPLEIPPREKKIGVLCALFAFGFWGGVPFYFKAVGHVHPVEILCHRVVWTVPLTVLILTFARGWDEVKSSIRIPGVLPTLCLTACLVALNWLTFIYAVTTGRVLQSSLGYFINPLVNVVLGMIFLRERLRPLQAAAVLLAAAGTVIMTVSHGSLPWISLVLAFSFSLYGFFRKTVRIEAVGGLFVETGLLFVPAVVFLLFLDSQGGLSFGRLNWHTTLLLVAAGFVNTLPLISFTVAARRLRFTTVGLFQYLTPSIHFTLAVFVFRETFTPVHLVTFGLIWLGLALFMYDSFMSHRHSFRAL